MLRSVAIQEKAPCREGALGCVCCAFQQHETRHTGRYTSRHSVRQPTFTILALQSNLSLNLRRCAVCLVSQSFRPANAILHTPRLFFPRRHWLADVSQSGTCRSRSRNLNTAAAKIYRRTTKERHHCRRCLGHCRLSPTQRMQGIDGA